MTKTTITQALAEIKTVAKRIDTKVAGVTEHLMQPAALRDPLERQGGSAKYVTEERQAINDLLALQVRIRRAIADANISNSITAGGQTRTIAEWLIWKREVAPKQSAFLRSLFNNIRNERLRAQAKGASIVTAGQDTKPADVVVNLDEKALIAEIEQLDTILGTLDGELSLKCATIFIEY